MGGHIVTLIAERHPDLYNAVFTVGAALCPTKQVCSIFLFFLMSFFPDVA